MAIAQRFLCDRNNNKVIGILKILFSRSHCLNLLLLNSAISAEDLPSRISTIDAHEVILETLPGATPQWDWSYRSELIAK